MAINRRFLYVGLFLVALGGVLVAVDLSAVDTSTLASALRLWPLALVAIGAGIVLRRSRFALVAGLLGAMIPGLVLGGGLALAPRYTTICGEGSDLQGASTQQGSFEGAGSVSVDVACGSISIGTQVGHDWQLTSTGTNGRVPVVEATDRGLFVRSAGRADTRWFGIGRDEWSLALPATDLRDVSVTVDAGQATVALPNANLGNLGITGNGADIAVDATEASISELDARLSFGRLSIKLPARGALSGAIRVGGGQLLLCVPFGLGVHVEFTGTPRDVRINGLETDGSIWQNEGYASAASHADLNIHVNFGSVVINPIGGCK